MKWERVGERDSTCCGKRHIRLSVVHFPKSVHSSSNPHTYRMSILPDSTRALFITRLRLQIHYRGYQHFFLYPVFQPRQFLTHVAANRLTLGQNFHLSLQMFLNILGANMDTQKPPSGIRHASRLHKKQFKSVTTDVGTLGWKCADPCLIARDSLQKVEKKSSQKAGHTGVNLENGQMWARLQFIFAYMYTCKCVGTYVVFVSIRS